MPDHVDAVSGELLAIPYPGEHQQLRAVDGAAAQHHLATRPDHPPPTGMLEWDPDRVCPIEQHPRGGGLREQCEVPAPQDRLEIGVRATPAGTPALGHHGFAEAIRLRRIRLLDPVPALLGCFAPGPGRAARAALAGDHERTVLDSFEI